MFKSSEVKDPCQIGFYLSATIHPGVGKPSQSTSVIFDRKKIVACHCTCNPSADWCALCTYVCIVPT